MSLVEHFLRISGLFQLRCRHCDHRFSFSLWDPRNLAYARCPRCYRLDLSQWNENHYHVPTGQKILLALGARRHRCEACRCNFVGFRPAKAKYVRAARA